jgi:hypothetical protein
MADLINHPPHYPAVLGVDCRDIIHELGLSYSLGCAFSYIWRAGRKEGNTMLQDLKKARNHLDYYIQRLESEEQ